MRLPPFMARYPMFIQSANYCFLTNNLPSRKTFFKNIKLDLSIYKHVWEKRYLYLLSGCTGVIIHFAVMINIRLAPSTILYWGKT